MASRIGLATYSSAVFEQFLIQAVVDLTQLALPLARAVVPSKTLSSAMTARYLAPGVGDLYVPHYWAVILHDGRGPVYPGKGAKFLVFFINSRDDPRLSNGYPVDPNDNRRLTKQEFEYGLAENYRRYLLNPGGGQHQFMLVVKEPKTGAPKHVGPAKGTFFFTLGMESFERKDAPDLIYREFDRMVRRHAPRSGTAPAAKARLR